MVFFCLPAVGNELLSLSELLETKVTSLGKESRGIMRTPTAIYVLNEDDISASGATRFSELLKMVPGMWVTEYSFDQVGYGIRSTVNMIAPTFLLLLDGVPLNSPLLGGTYLSGFDISLERIERVEIIRGSVGTIYGANAVNGVISIFTKGGRKVNEVGARYELGSNGYSAPSTWFQQDLNESTFLSGWMRWKKHNGYAQDPDLRNDSLTVSGNVMDYLSPDRSLRYVQDTTVANPYFGTTDNKSESFVAGVKLENDLGKDMSNTLNVFFRDSRQDYALQYAYPLPLLGEGVSLQDALVAAPDSIFPFTQKNDRITISNRLDISLQNKHNIFIHTWWSQQRLDIPASSGLKSRTWTSEVEIQDNMRFSGGHGLSAGVNLRKIEFNLQPPAVRSNIFFTEPYATNFIYAGFLQGRYLLLPEVEVHAGSKAEVWTLLSNTPEWSGNSRLLWTPTQDITFWSNISRSIGVSGKIEKDVEMQLSALPFLTGSRWISLVNNESIEPSRMHSLETGTRMKLLPGLLFDLTAFRNSMENFTTISPLDTSFQTRVADHQGDSVTPIFYGNFGTVNAYGTEMILRFNGLQRLRGEASYSYFHQQQSLDFGDLKGMSIMSDRNSETYPVHVIRAKLFLELPFRIRSDFFATWTSGLETDNRYNYILMRSVTKAEGGIWKNQTTEPFELEATLQKSFFADRLKLRLWGRHLLANEAFVENYNLFIGKPYPTLIERTFGSDISLVF